MRYLFSVLFISFLLILSTSQIQAQIVNIPDANFKAALVNHVTVIDSSGDGEIQVSEANSFIGSLNIGSSNISDFTGLETFISTSSIECNDNPADSIDFSQNVSVTNIAVGGSNLVYVHLGNLPLLTDFNFAENWIGTSDFNNSGFSHLDFSGCPALKWIGAPYPTYMTSLNISNCVNLEVATLQFGAPFYQNLDFSHCPNFSALKLYNYEDWSLDLSLNPAFDWLEIANCSRIGSIDFSSNPLLVHLTIENVPLWDLQLSSNPNLAELWVNGTQIVQLDLSSNSNLYDISIGCNHYLQSVNLKNGNNQEFETNSYGSISLYSFLPLCVEVDDPAHSDTTWRSAPDYSMISEESVLFTAFCSSISAELDPNFKLQFDTNLNLGCAEVDTIRIAATGWSTKYDGDFFYDWYFNGTKVKAFSGLHDTDKKHDTIFYATQAGTYYVTVVSYCDSLVYSDTITINNTPVPSPMASIDTVSSSHESCDSVILHSTGNSNLLFGWLKDGVEINSSQLILNDSILRITESGNYQAVVSNMGCRDTSTAISTTIYSSNILISAQTPSGNCKDPDLLNVGNKGFLFEWLLDGANFTGPTLNDSIINSVAPGNYQLIIDYGVCLDTSEAFVVNGGIDSILAVNDTIGNTAIDCDSVGLIAKFNDGNGFEWFENGFSMGSSTLNDSVLYAVNSGNYHVVITQDHCSDTSEIIAVSVFSINTALIDTLTYYPCKANEIVSLGNVGNNFEWIKDGISLGSPTLNDSILTYLDSAAYQVIVNSGVCSDSSNLFTPLASVDTFTAIIDTLSPSLNECDSIGFVSAGNSGKVFQWRINGSFLTFPTLNDSSYYTSIDSGNIYVVVSEGTCRDTSSSINVDFKGVKARNLYEKNFTYFFQAAYLPCNNDPLVHRHVNASTNVEWLRDGISISTPTPQDTFLLLWEDGDYQAVISNAYCSDTSNIYTITGSKENVHANIFFAADSTDCDSLHLMSINNSGKTFEWFRNGVSLGPTTLNDSIRTAFSSGYYRVVVSNGTCLDTSITKQVTIYSDSNPINLIGQTPAGNCKNADIVHFGSIGYSMEWLYNGVNYSGPSLNDSIVSNVAGGNYQLIIDYGICMDTSDVYLVNGGIDSIIAVNDTIGNTAIDCDSIGLVAKFNIGNDFEWFKDGISTGASTTNDSILYAASSGNYYVVITQDHCKDTSSIISVSIIGVTAALDTAISSNPCFNDSLISSGNFGNTFEWIFNNTSLNSPTINDSTISFWTDGNYQVIVSNGTCVDTSTIYSAFGTIDTFTANIDTIGNSATDCDMVDMISNGNSGKTFEWLYNSNSIQAASIIDSVFSADSSGNYQVVVSESGCRDTSSAIYININGIQADLDTIFNFDPCDNINLIASNFIGSTFEWLFTGISIGLPTLNDSLLHIDQNGSYQVIIDNGLCIDTSSIFVATNIIDSFAANIDTIGSSATDCNAVGLVSNGNDGKVYSWLIDGLPFGITDSTVNCSISGNYQVVVSESGCSDTSSTIFISIDEGQAILDTLGDMNNCQNVILINYGNNGHQFEWFNNGSPLASPQTNDSTLIVGSNGSYSLIVDNGVCQDTSNTILVTTCDSTLSTIFGLVFYDENNDGIYNGSDTPFSGVRVYLNSGQSTNSNGLGYYQFRVDSGSYDIFIDMPTFLKCNGNTWLSGFYTADSTYNIPVVIANSVHGDFDFAIASPEPPCGTICGHVFQDYNNNGIQDVGELGLWGTNIQISPGGIVQTNVLGDYCAVVPFGVPTEISWSAPANPYCYSIVQTQTFPITPLTYNTTLSLGNPTSNNNDFGVGYSLGFDARVVSVRTTFGNIAGQDFYAFMDYKTSNGPNPDSCFLTLEYDDQYIDDLGSHSIAPFETGPGYITWAFGPGQAPTFNCMGMNFHVDSVTNIGDTLFWQANYECGVADICPHNDTLKRNVVVVDKAKNGFDFFNNMQVYDLNGEKDQLNLDFDAPTLSYVINYQNVGSDSVFHLRIIDTLPAELDILSVSRPFGTIPTATFEISNDNVLIWESDQVSIPGSEVDYINSYGFVQFDVTLKENLTPGTIIENEANILYNYDRKVYTNTTQVLILSTDGQFEMLHPTDQVLIYPNPTTGSVHIQLNQSLNNGIFNLYDLAGRKVVSKNVHGMNQQFNLNHLDKGVYLYKIQDAHGFDAIGKLVVN